MRVSHLKQPLLTWNCLDRLATTPSDSQHHWWPLWTTAVGLPLDVTPAPRANHCKVGFRGISAAWPLPMMTTPWEVLGSKDKTPAPTPFLFALLVHGSWNTCTAASTQVTGKDKRLLTCPIGLPKSLRPHLAWWGSSLLLPGGSRCQLQSRSSLRWGGPSSWSFSTQAGRRKLSCLSWRHQTVQINIHLFHQKTLLSIPSRI